MALLTIRRSQLSLLEQAVLLIEQTAATVRVVEYTINLHKIKFRPLEPAFRRIKTKSELLTMLKTSVANKTPEQNNTQLLSALSRHTLRLQKNINDRVVIAMTEKLTLVQLSSESIGYRHDATQ